MSEDLYWKLQGIGKSIGRLQLLVGALLFLQSVTLVGGGLLALKVYGIEIEVRSNDMGRTSAPAPTLERHRRKEAKAAQEAASEPPAEPPPPVEPTPPQPPPEVVEVPLEQPPAEPPRPRSRSLLDQGWEAVERGELSTAQGAFRQAVGSDPNNAAANYGYAYTLIKQGNTRGAESYLCTAKRNSYTDVELNRQVVTAIERNGLSCP